MFYQVDINSKVGLMPGEVVFPYLMDNTCYLKKKKKQLVYLIIANASVYDIGMYHCYASK